MNIPSVVLSVIVLLLAGVLAAPLARHLRFPFTAVLVLVGYAGSTLVVSLGYDTGLRAGIFHELVFFVFLPVLVFESAYNIELRLLLKNLVPVLFLAVVVMLLSALATAVGLYYGIGHARGFPWIAALLTGVLLAATDPVAVVAQLKERGVSKRLGILIEGESLFNDATAIVFFELFLAMALAPGGEATSFGGIALEFLVVFLGGAAVGALIGGVGMLLLRWLRDGVLQGLVSLLTAYGGFLLAEEVLHVSGVMAVLATGLILAEGVRRYAAPATCGSLAFLWEFVGYVANALLFLLVGVVVSLPMFQERWLAMLIAIGAVLVARTACVFGTLPLISPMLPEPVPLRYQAVMVWGGLRGAVTLALALALPTDLDYWWTIQSIAFGVVLFTLFVQAPTMGLLLKGVGVAGIPGETAAAPGAPVREPGE